VRGMPENDPKTGNSDATRTTRRPLSRPMSARVNRYMDAIQYRVAAQQIAVDQANSMEQAQQFREMHNEVTKEALARQSELRAMHIEAFKERKQLVMERQANNYYRTEQRRGQERQAKANARHEAHCDRVYQKDDRAYHAELKKQQMRKCERIWGAICVVQNEQSQSGAAEHRSQLIEQEQQRLEQARSKREEKMETFVARRDRRSGLRQVQELSKEINRTQAHMMQLQGNKRAWQLACKDHNEMTNPELLIEQKIDEEADRLASLRAAMVEQMPKPPQRPRSANATSIRPKTSGIGGFCSDTPRRNAPLFVDATSLGPRIVSVDARVGVGILGY